MSEPAIYEIFFRFKKPTAETPANQIAAAQIDHWDKNGTPANQPRRIRSEDAPAIAEYLNAALIDQAQAAEAATAAAIAAHAAELVRVREEHEAAMTALRTEATEVIGNLNAALAAEREEKAALIVRRANDLETMRKEHAEEVRALTDRFTAEAEARDEQRAKLSALFDLLPEELQLQFVGPFATVRGLLESGKKDLALKFVESLPVPEGMGNAKAAILAALA